MPLGINLNPFENETIQNVFVALLLVSKSEMNTLMIHLHSSMLQRYQTLHNNLVQKKLSLALYLQKTRIHLQPLDAPEL
jgi:hypothetical protein